ncbi:MAG: CocE/NonD family hydrolase [Bacteroidota bacterium]
MKNSLLLLLCLLFLGQAQAQEDILTKLSEIAVIDQKVMMPMRDGIRLCTDIYRPKTEGPVPVIFSKTPYNFNSYRDGELSTWTMKRAYEAVSRGYAYVVQNERGRYFSQGEWDILGTPVTDGYDALTWMAEQDWCNGKVGTIGCSSTAEWQMALAAMDHPAHAAMVPQAYGAGVGTVGRFFEQGNWFRGGAEQMLFFAWLYSVQNDRIRPMFPADATQEELIRNARYFDLAPERPKVDWAEALWHLPLTDMLKAVDGPIGIYEDMIRRKPNDPDWFKGGLYHAGDGFGVPSFWFASWFDVSTGPNLELFNHVQEEQIAGVSEHQYMVVAPTLHCRFTRATENTMVGDLNVGDARLNYDELIYGWFDYWLKGEGDYPEMPKVKYYTMGTNEWQEAETWPPANVATRTLYLRSSGQANSLFGDGQLLAQAASKGEKEDVFTYDPGNPVMSNGGNVCCTGNAVKGGSFDQQKSETRQDILVYSTGVLEEDLEVSGFIEATLYVGSDAKDTDFTIKLIDVHPDGTAYNLDETIQRARYREGYDKEVFMEEGEVYKLEMSPLSTSNVFKKGHQLRIEISSSNFPRFARNLNTGGNNYDESEWKVAKNRIYHSAEYPSQIRIPVQR